MLAVAKQGKALGAYKLARYAYDKLQVKLIFWINFDFCRGFTSVSLLLELRNCRYVFRQQIWITIVHKSLQKLPSFPMLSLSEYLKVCGYRSGLSLPNKSPYFSRGKKFRMSSCWVIYYWLHLVLQSFFYKTVELGKGFALAVCHSINKLTFECLLSIKRSCMLKQSLTFKGLSICGLFLKD